MRNILKKDGCIILTFLALVFGLGLISSCSKSNDKSNTSVGENPKTLERIVSTKTLRIGYVNFPPVVYKDVKTQAMEGHFVLAVEEIAKQMGVTCEYIEASWSTFAAGLQNKQFDLSIAPTFGTIPRAMAVSFTRPLMYVGNSAIVKKGETRFHSIKDIDKQGIVVAVTQGEAGHEYADANIKKAKVIVQSQGDQTLTFSQVIAGRADIALGDAYVTAQFASAHPDEVKDLFAQNPYNLTAVCWAVRPNDLEFLEFINTAIDVLDSTGKLTEYERKYDAHWLHLERRWITY